MSRLWGNGARKSEIAAAVKAAIQSRERREHEADAHTVTEKIVNGCKPLREYLEAR